MTNVRWLFALLMLTLKSLSAFTYILRSKLSLLGATKLIVMQGQTNDDEQQAPAAAQKCIPCESMDSSFLLSNAQIQEKITTMIPLWTSRLNSMGVSVIARSFVAKSFQAALDCINAVGAIAEDLSHHPDVHLTNYREVEIVIYTHKLGGVTENDIALAKAIDGRVKVEYSPKWLREHPEAASTAA